MAGARAVHHMHGRLFQSRCADPACGAAPFDDRSSYDGGAPLPRCAACGALVRPHVCWFGEVPFGLDTIAAALQGASAVLVVGTSGLVYPAAAFVLYAQQIRANAGRGTRPPRERGRVRRGPYRSRPRRPPRAGGGVARPRVRVIHGRPDPPSSSASRRAGGMLFSPA
jgi:hypothetical protein